MRILFISLILIFETFWIFYPIHHVDNELKQYNDYFLYEVNKYCDKSQFSILNKTIIKFDDLNRGELGVCRRALIRFEVLIDKKSWDRSQQDRKFSTITHELTHCYLKEEHSPNPNHYMYATENNLPTLMVMLQLEELLKKKCHK